VEASAVSSDELLQRLSWYSTGWSVELKPELLRSAGPPHNPPFAEDGKPASLSALCAAYELAARPEAWQPMLVATLCGGERERSRFIPLQYCQLFTLPCIIVATQ
jgi:hypothetical protein